MYLLKKTDNMRRFITLIITAFVCVTIVTAQNREVVNNYSSKFGQILFYINNYYLDTINNEKITDEAFKAMLQQLDPHSSYVAAKDVQALNEPLQGNFEGIGIEFAIVKDTLTVVSPLSGGPSEKVGIRSGDKIVAVGDENIASISMTTEKVYSYLRGPKGSKVVLSIVRRGVKEPISFEVVRDKIPINSVDVTYEVQPGIAYVKLSRFAAKSAEEIITSLIDLNVRDLTGLILDLRGNSGGFLGSAIEIANFFLESGQTIVYTEGARVPPMRETANGLGFYKNGDLVILIDEGSASASEIVAGAIQDWDRGTIIGRRSFGKGLVQQMLPLSDGSELRLTIARYHTPSGRVIQSPYEAGNIEKYYKALYDRYEKDGEMYNAESIQFPDSLKYTTLKKERIVYGGGGIMPDIFIPADTTNYTNYYGALVRRSIVLDFMNDMSDVNRDIWSSKYKNFDSFDKEFIVDKQLMDNLVAFGQSKGLEPNYAELEHSKRQIEIYMKALAARSIFGMTGYFKIVNSYDDPAFKKAIEVLTTGSR